MRPFHLAFPVTDLDITKSFYVDVLQCNVGRSSDKWIDFDMFGHQVVAHLVDRNDHPSTNSVDGDDVPASHFGVILTIDQWNQLRNHLSNFNIKFIIKPKIRFKGEPGEQATMFFLDPSGNALEFKAFKDDKQIFAT
ncbi:MAG: glyoxalase [Candidatus Marinimicrobia bacterium]|jgi:extradiol dioxygenase family protein|nr:glyoxalase [Candidatus Neomarinimicrobiota bacterium]|tara:strand:+ start:942 stop:1352 length:411 start_codon:yes stop_codon:yes gene_type:complete